MWMELNEMELNGREDLLNPNASTEIAPHYIPYINNTPLTKWSYTNSPPKNDYYHIQNYSLFLSRMTKGKSVK